MGEGGSMLAFVKKEERGYDMLAPYSSQELQSDRYGGWERSGNRAAAGCKEMFAFREEGEGG